MYRAQGLGWPEIAARLPGRVAEQIRARFVNYIDPQRKTTAWTDEEDNLLTILQRRYGNKWTEISNMLPGRSENSIKNRWHNRKTKQRRAFKRIAEEKAAAARAMQESSENPCPTKSSSVSDGSSGMQL